MNRKFQPPTLTGRQKRYLRGLGHHLQAVVIVGKEGMSDNLIESVRQALAARELIKVKLGQNCPVDKREAAQDLASLTGASLVQLIGRTILLYLPNKELNNDRRIQLPS